MTTVFRLQLRCTGCGHKFQRTVPSLDASDPPCPRCAKQQEDLGLDFTRSPPAIGGSPAVRAMDYTMETVAQEYGFSDLSTDAREGMTMAPKLPPAQQAAADAMFDAKARQAQIARQNPVVAAKLQQIAATAMAGGYRQNDPVNAPDPIAVMQKGIPQGTPIRANFVAGDGVR